MTDPPAAAGAQDAALARVLVMPSVANLRPGATTLRFGRYAPSSDRATDALEWPA